MRITIGSTRNANAFRFHLSWTLNALRLRPANRTVRQDEINIITWFAEIAKTGKCGK